MTQWLRARHVRAGVVVAVIAAALVVPLARGADNPVPQGSIFTVQNETGVAQTINARVATTIKPTTNGRLIILDTGIAAGWLQPRGLNEPPDQQLQDCLSTNGRHHDESRSRCGSG